MATSDARPNADDHQPAGQPDLDQALSQAIEGLLRRLPPDLAEAIRLGAVPHRFDAELLGLLRPRAAGTGSLLEEMRRLGLLGETASGWLTYHDRLRSHLLAGLQSQPAMYHQANARAADYFAARMARVGNPYPESDLLEHLYHLLAADEATGLSQLRHHFDGFRQTGQIGLAEQSLAYALEQQPALSQAGRDWLRYLGAQLRQSGPGLEASQQTFRELAAESDDPLLRAVARRSLGEMLARSQQWAAGIDELQAALRTCQQMGDPLETAHTQAVLGAAFVSLAEAAGGLRDEVSPLASGWARWWYHLEHAPFLAYCWFSRRLAWVPNLYFGTDYQNWIVVRYMYGAIRWFARAERTLDRADARDDVARTYIRIRLADLRHRIGRWSQAERRFAALAQDPAVRGSSYLLGLVQLGQGRALLARGRPRQALHALRECEAVFRQYGDLHDAGKAAGLTGQAYARLGELEQAADAYRAAAEAFYATDDLLNATEALAERPVAGEGDLARAAEPSGQFGRLAYIERFPGQSSGSLHRLFRLLATFLALPITGLLIIVVALLVPVLWIAAIEILLFSGAAPGMGLILLADLAKVLPVLLVLPLFATWAYEAIYVLAGVLVARLLPLPWIARQQPVYWVLDEESLGQYDQQGRLVDRMRWSEIAIVASLDRAIWHSPLTLLSRTLIGNSEKTWIVDGILNRYLQFKGEVRNRLRAQPQPVRAYTLDLTFLDLKWSLAMLAVTALVAGISSMLKVVDPERGFIEGLSPGGAHFTLLVTDIAYQFWMWLVFTGPLFVLIHLLINRRSIRRALGDRVQMGAVWPIWLALCVVLYSTLRQLWLLFA